MDAGSDAGADAAVVPDAGPTADTWTAPVTGNPDAIHAVFLKQLNGTVELTSVRSFGPGTYPQPI